MYSAMELSGKIRKQQGPTGRPVLFSWTDSTPEEGEYGIRWGGEWAFTYQFFRDLGAAMVVVLFLIYVMLVAWYQSFLTPIVVMLPIPLVLVGVVFAHLILGLAMSGLGVMGMICLAGLMVRNSILIVDFARTMIAEGTPIKDAVINASVLRLRPIMLTSAAVILGEGVLYFDEFLQTLGVSLVGGAFVSTALTLILVPLAYFQLVSFLARRRPAPEGGGVE